MTNTIGEKMNLKNVIVWILLLGIIVLLMSTSVQAKELTEVNAIDILKQIENGENIYLENVRIKGELNLSKIVLETVPSARSAGYIEDYGLEKELKIVESNIIIQDSFFEEDVDFSNTEFRKDIDFSRTTFLGEIDFKSANFSRYADFGSANFAGYANFRSANFAGYADFRSADFAGYADFVSADFAGTANFGSADFAGYATFYSTEFNKVSFTWATFTNVSLVESDFNRMKVEWSSLRDTLDFDGPTYIKLIRKFREIEQFEDADAAYYQYRRLSQAKKSGLSQS